MKLILLLFTITVFVSCNKHKSEDNGDERAIDIETCYRYVGNKDTIELSARIQDSTVTGTLVYKLFEKDKNEGTIQGYMKGELIIADYVFTSEGTSSVRQVVFRKSGNVLIEGYGDVVSEKEKTMFKNIDSLNFDNSISLQQVDCNA